MFLLTHTVPIQGLIVRSFHNWIFNILMKMSIFETLHIAIDISKGVRDLTFSHNSVSCRGHSFELVVLVEQIQTNH